MTGYFLTLAKKFFRTNVGLKLILFLDKIYFVYYLEDYPIVKLLKEKTVYKEVCRSPYYFLSFDEYYCRPIWGNISMRKDGINPVTIFKKVTNSFSVTHPTSAYKL